VAGAEKERPRTVAKGEHGHWIVHLFNNGLEVDGKPR
jgi:hypothetical protein